MPQNRLTPAQLAVLARIEDPKKRDVLLKVMLRVRDERERD